ncbi:hypothetical protein ADT25_15650 [Xanthomonas oryzae]|uniref:NADP-dependent oxidoreductase domain-containing protein n=1 Tax=Xanthomonas oryzae TaxID=347 RepID=A0AAP1EXN7_9XANT|nr:hypothetical protein ADT25_15650 [Xanthomonas oryzae]QBG83061.1 hypothetical protein EYR27_02650 [Xanthomonas oryzae]
MAYLPLGSRALLDHPVLHAIGARRGVAATAVAVAWAIRSGEVIAIPESETAAHVCANAAACGLQLDARDLAELDRAFPAPKRKQPLDLLQLRAPVAPAAGETAASHAFGNCICIAGCVLAHALAIVRTDM